MTPLILNLALLVGAPAVVGALAGLFVGWSYGIRGVWGGIPAYAAAAAAALITFGAAVNFFVTRDIIDALMSALGK